MLFFNYLRFFNQLVDLKPLISPSLFKSIFLKTFFFKKYFFTNELLWQEGLLIDFLQKKLIDKWTRRFLILTAYVINERFFYDWVYRFYISLFIWPGHKFFIFEFSSIGQTLFILVLLSTFTFLLLVLWYLTYFIRL